MSPSANSLTSIVVAADRRFGRQRDGGAEHGRRQEGHAVRTSAVEPVLRLQPDEVRRGTDRRARCRRCRGRSAAAAGNCRARSAAAADVSALAICVDRAVAQHREIGRHVDEGRASPTLTQMPSTRSLRRVTSVCARAGHGDDEVVGAARSAVRGCRARSCRTAQIASPVKLDVTSTWWSRHRRHQPLGGGRLRARRPASSDRER